MKDNTGKEIAAPDAEVISQRIVPPAPAVPEPRVIFEDEGAAGDLMYAKLMGSVIPPEILGQSIVTFTSQDDYNTGNKILEFEFSGGIVLEIVAVSWKFR